MNPHRSNPDSARRPAGRRGTTIVEVLWTCVILAVVALAAGSFVSLSTGIVSVTRNHRLGLEAANSRLEDLRSAGFDAVKPPTENFTTNYLTWSGSAWVHSPTDPGEVLTILGQSYPIITTVVYVDKNGGSASYDVLHASAFVKYRKSEPNTVRLWAYIGP
jgi:type II secretory pathway pseudopilin PulG